MTNQLTTAPQLHLFYGGQSTTLPLADLDLGDASTDDEIRTAIAKHGSIPVDALAIFQIDREPNGNITVRPAATWG